MVPPYLKKYLERIKRKVSSYTIQYLPTGTRDLYTSICSAFLSNRNSIKISGSQNLNEALGVLSRCLLDVPTAINFKSELSFEKTLFEQMLYIGKLPISVSRLAVMKNELNEKVNQILLNPELKGCKCDSEILCFIYKHIQSTTEYDNAEVVSHQHPLSHTAYGSLVNQLSVCDGNAKGMILLCQKLGIPCMGVDGTMNNGGHSWVIVQCNGKWFHSDPTFKYLLNGSPDYSHWLQSDDEIAITHQWNRAAYPICSHKNTILDSQIISTSVSLKKDQIGMFHNTYALLPFELEDAVLVESIPAYQKILKTAIINKNKIIIVKFNMSFGVINPELYLNLFERMVTEILSVSMEYTYKFYRDHRILIIEWK